jgi:hypothetical protein
VQFVQFCDWALPAAGLSATSSIAVNAINARDTARRLWFK